MCAHGALADAEDAAETMDGELLLGGEGSHGEDWVGMVRVGGKGVELWWG